MKTPCCPEIGRRKKHRHLRHLPHVGDDVPSCLRYNGPNPDIEIVIELLKKEDREIDQINGGQGSLAMVIAKELYGKESQTRY